MHKNLRGGSVDSLVRALAFLGYRFCKSPHHYKRGKFHVIITVHSDTRCSLSLHRDRLRWLFGGHEAVWHGRDLDEEMTKIMIKYHQLREG